MSPASILQDLLARVSRSSIPSTGGAGPPAAPALGELPLVCLPATASPRIRVPGRKNIPSPDRRDQFGRPREVRILNDPYGGAGIRRHLHVPPDSVKIFPADVGGYILPFQQPLQQIGIRGVRGSVHLLHRPAPVSFDPPVSPPCRAVFPDASSIAVRIISLGGTTDAP
jgi:hypothetical protein